MNPADEKKLLVQVLRRLESPPQSILAAKWFLPVAWVVCVIAFILAFQAGERFGSGILAITFAVLGIFIGIIAFARACAKQEPIMRKHLDRESITRRLAELDT